MKNGVTQDQMLYNAIGDRRKWDAARACNNIIDALVKIRSDADLPMIARNAINDIVKIYTRLSNIIVFDSDAEDSAYDGLAEALTYYNDNISTGRKF